MLDLSAILAAPDDDAPRLALARKLGRDPLGAFIKLQCTSPGAPAAQKLLRDHYEDFVGPKVAAGIEAMSARFERGFLDAIAFDHSTWGGLSGPKVVRCIGQQSLSLVRRVTFMNGAGGPDASRTFNEAGANLNGTEVKGPKIPAVRLLRDEVMQRVREVRGLDSDSTLELAVGKGTLDLEVLGHFLSGSSSFPTGALRSETVLKMKKAPGLPRLRALAVSHCRLDEVEALAKAPLLARIETLTFTTLPGRDAAAAVLAATKLPVQRLAFVEQKFDFRLEVNSERALRLERAGSGWRAAISVAPGRDQKEATRGLEALLASLKK